MEKYNIFYNQYGYSEPTKTHKVYDLGDIEPYCGSLGICRNIQTVDNRVIYIFDVLVTHFVFNPPTEDEQRKILNFLYKKGEE
jgi:hypothetical protein